MGNTPFKVSRKSVNPKVPINRDRHTHKFSQTCKDMMIIQNGAEIPDAFQNEITKETNGVVY
jgi:hypothetical protein